MYRENNLSNVCRETAEPNNKRLVTEEDYEDYRVNGICYMLSAEEIGPPVSKDLRLLTDSINPNYELILDSGCSQHMFNSYRNLSNFIIKLFYF